MIDLPACPVCPGRRSIRSLELTSSTKVQLYRCDNCMGVLANHDAVVAAKRRYPASHPIMIGRPNSPRCRYCQSRTRTGAERCQECSRSLLLTCSKCAQHMGLVQIVDIVIDVCRQCELAYFDRGEFARVCDHPWALLRALRLRGRSSESSVSFDALDVIPYSPDALVLLGEAAGAAGEGALRTAQGVVAAAGHIDAGSAVASAGELALEASAGAVEVASGAGEAILELLSEIF